ISRQRNFLVQWLLKRELATAAIRVCGHYVLAEKITAKANMRFRLECLLRHRIGISTGVVRFVSHWEKQIVAHDHGPSVVTAVVHLPFHRWRDGGRVRSWLDVAED